MMSTYDMAKQIETKWDGITTVAATAGITLVSLAAVITGQTSPQTLLLVIATLSGIGGYSAHNLVSRGGDK